MIGLPSESGAAFTGACLFCALLCAAPAQARVGQPPMTPVATATATPIPVSPPARAAAPALAAGESVTPAGAPVGPVLDPISSPIVVGGTLVLSGSGFTAGSVVELFVGTASGPAAHGPFVPDAWSAGSLTWSVDPGIALGNGFGTVQVVNTDQGYAASNLRSQLLYGAGGANIPTIFSVDGIGLRPADPSTPTANVETVVVQGATVTIGGSGFSDPLVNLFTAEGSEGPLTPLDGGSSTRIQVVIPPTAPTGPGSLQVVNSPYTGNVVSNAVSLPIGARIDINGVSQTATTVTAVGTGFSSRTVVNLFNGQGGGAVNLGGLDAGGNAKIPLTSVSATRLTFEVPAAAADGPAFVQLLNPPFIPFSSTGNDPDGAFHLVVPGSVSLQTLTTGLSSPTAIATPGDSRLFINLQPGRIVVWDGSQILPAPFLDIQSLVGTGSERGLLGLAFHPRYAQNGLFFIDYTDTSGNTVIARYRVSAGDPNLADAGSGVTLLHVTQPFANHNGGQLQFGADGYLYIGLGDGGSAGDPGCRAQSDATLLGKLLRIDVDQNTTMPPYYGIPAGNPFAGPGDPPDEVWAKGLRNPWRFSFDRLTHDLFIADVGQSSLEEVDFQPAGIGGGQNYGWKIMEGTSCYSTSACPAGAPACNDPSLVLPILEYGHVDGNCAITGGYVYRGSLAPSLYGAYVYGDYCSGHLWAARRTGGEWASQPLAPSAAGLTSFGEDAAGELYLVTQGGGLYRLD
jgi:glucose/arabinose dehydrogenase